MNTMQSHVAQQRQTGFMTASEADALLAQYRLQSEFESVQATMPRTRRERIDWRAVDGAASGSASASGEGSSASGHGHDAGSVRGSVATTTASTTGASEDHPRSAGGSAAMSPQGSLQLPYPLPGSYNPSPAASSVSLAPSTSSSSNGQGMTTTYPYQFRRGANSLFGGGGNAHSASASASVRGVSPGARMTKSGSSGSVVSAGGSDRARSSEGHGRGHGEDDEPGGALEGGGATGAQEAPVAAQSEGAPEVHERAPGSHAGGEGEDRQSLGGQAAGRAASPAGASAPSAAETASVRAEELAAPVQERNSLVDDKEHATDPTPSLDDSTSPTSPVNDADLHGLTTFNAPSSPPDERPSSPLSPAASDTEAVDPFFERMAVPPARSPSSTSSSRDAPGSLLPAATQADPEPLATPRPASPTAPSSPSPSASPALATPPSPHTARPSPSPLPSIVIPASPSRARSRPRALSLESDDAGETPSTAAGGASSASDSADSPLPGSLVEGPSDLSELGVESSEADLTVSDRPPFDLSLGEGDVTVEEGEMSGGEAGGGLRELDAPASGVTARLPRAAEDEGAAAGGERGSTITLDSTGSSFHEAPEAPPDSDDDVGLLADRPVSLVGGAVAAVPTSPAASSRNGYLSASSRPQSLGLSSPDLDPAAPDAALLRPTSLPLYRQGSNELHQVLASALGRDGARGAGDEGDDDGQCDSSDLILQDLVAIQERLVQSAARRAQGLSPRSMEQQRAEEDGEEGDEGELDEPASSLEPTSPLRIRKRETTDSTATATASPVGSPSRPPPRQDWAQSSDSLGDLGGALAGLGLMSLTAFDVDGSAAPSESVGTGSGAQADRSWRMSSSAQRTGASRRTSDLARTSVASSSRMVPDAADRLGGDGDAALDYEHGYERDSSLFGGPTSTRMTAQTSQTSSRTSPRAYSAITPSTTQSDAFEFSSLVGSRALLYLALSHYIPDRGMSPIAETTSLAEGEDHGREESLNSGSDRTQSSPQVGETGSPVVDGLPPQEAVPTGGLLSVDPARDEPQAGPDPSSSSSRHGPSSSVATTSTTLGEPAPIDTESFLRVPRNMPRRDPSKTTSMLVRDVRNQATLATIALKKQSPSSPPTKSLAKSRSVRKMSISSPQLVSGPINIPAVPIASPQVVDSSRFRVSRSKTRKQKDEASGSAGKSSGLGSRFKTLLKKQQSRDQLGHLNGDEITPFVDAAARDRRIRTSGIPITPPNQSTAQFESPSSQRTPSSSDGSAATPRQGRSPAYRPSSRLRTLGEVAERSSTVSGASDSSPHSSSSRPSAASSHGRTLSRGSPREGTPMARQSGESSRERGSVLARPASSPPTPEPATLPPLDEVESDPSHRRALAPPVAIVDGPSTLTVPASPSLGSLASRKSSEYAGSFIDFYANDSSDEPPSSPYDEAALAQAYEGFDSLQLSQHGSGRQTLSVDEQLALQHEHDLTARLRPVSQFEEHPEFGNAYGPAYGGAGTGTTSPAPSGSGGPGGGGGPEDEIVWQVLDDLRNNRDSVVSKDSSFGFSSGNSSFGVDEPAVGGGEDTNAIAGMLRCAPPLELPSSLASLLLC